MPQRQPKNSQLSVKSSFKTIAPMLIFKHGIPKNGILFYSAKGYTGRANDATYTEVIYTPTTKIDGGLSNTTLNGGLYSKTVSFGAGASLKAFQAAGFRVTTYILPPCIISLL